MKIHEKPIGTLTPEDLKQLGNLANNKIANRLVDEILYVNERLSGILTDVRQLKESYERAVANVELARRMGAELMDLHRASNAKANGLYNCLAGMPAPKPGP